jgi:cytochrome c oxidase cbb3-type subunit 3
MPAILLTLLLVVPQGNPFRADPAASETGRGMFRIYCAPCHGIRAAGGRAPDLTASSLSSSDREGDLYRVIFDGVSGTEMQGYGATVGSDNVWRLVSYIRSVADRPAAATTGNASAGEKLFWGKGRCGQCHRVGTRGSGIGPDLTAVGRSRSVAYLRESVVAPNADLTPGFATVKVVTPDGKTIIGVARAIDNFSAQLVDLAENFHSVLRSEARIEREYRSLMPGDYAKTFTASELDDIVAYLGSLRERRP